MDITIGFSTTQYQKPPETVSEVENLKIFQGEHSMPKTPYFMQVSERDNIPC